MSRGKAAALAEVRNLRVKLGGRAVLDGVQLSVHRGEVVALVGPNGAGKSTLLGVLSGDVSACGGDVLLDGRPLTSIRTADQARLRAVLPQQNKSMFSFTGRQIVGMGRFPWPDEHDTDRHVNCALERVGATDFADQAYPTLSGGEQTLINLARVLAQSTELVMLDEPTAALDLGHQERVLTLAADLARQNRAVLVVLHDLNLAARYAHTAVVLARGRVAATGSPHDAFTTDVLSRIYAHPVCVIEHPFHPGRPLVLPAPV